MTERDTCACSFVHWLDEFGERCKTPRFVDPDCPKHGTHGTERCKDCRSLRVPCGCETGLKPKGDG